MWNKTMNNLHFVMHFMGQCIFIFTKWETKFCRVFAVIFVDSYWKPGTKWALRLALNYSDNGNSSLNIIWCSKRLNCCLGNSLNEFSSSLLAFPQLLKVMPECVPYQIYSTEAALCDSLWWEDGAPSCSVSSLAGSLEKHSHYSWKRLQTHLAPFSGFPRACSHSEFFFKRLGALFSMALH